MVCLTTLLVAQTRFQNCRMLGKEGIGKDKEFNSHGLVWGFDPIIFVEGLRKNMEKPQVNWFLSQGLHASCPSYGRMLHIWPWCLVKENLSLMGSWISILYVTYSDANHYVTEHIFVQICVWCIVQEVKSVTLYMNSNAVHFAVWYIMLQSVHHSISRKIYLSN